MVLAFWSAHMMCTCAKHILRSCPSRGSHLVLLFLRHLSDLPISLHGCNGMAQFRNLDWIDWLRFVKGLYRVCRSFTKVLQRFYKPYTNSQYRTCQVIVRKTSGYCQENVRLFYVKTKEKPDDNFTAFWLTTSDFGDQRHVDCAMSFVRWHRCRWRYVISNWH